MNLLIKKIMMENLIKTVVSLLIVLILGAVIWIMMCNKSGNRTIVCIIIMLKTFKKILNIYENEDLEKIENMMAENYESYFYPIKQT